MSTNPDAIAVLAAGIKLTPTGRWVSTDLTEEDDKLGAPGGKLRVRAAALLAMRSLEAFVVASGGRGFDVPADYPKERPMLCEILRDELIEAGVANERIISECDSNDTYQQLIALEKLVRERGWHTLAIVSNKWHLPRVRATLAAKFPEMKAIELVGAEDVLNAYDVARREGDIAAEYAKKYMQKRMQKEQEGIVQIKDGTYQFH